MVGVDYNLIQKYNYSWMDDALNYQNSRRGFDGNEDFSSKWFTQFEGVEWSQPFFRHIDGHNHTHFLLDFDVRVNPSVIKQYDRFPDRLRNLKLEILIEFLREWVLQHSEHQFFWKCSGTGIHAIQRVNKRIDRRQFVPLILELFPPTSSIKVNIDGGGKIEVPPINYVDDKARYHNPSHEDDGWCLAWNPKDKKYDKQNWTRIIRKDNIDFFINIDMVMFYDTTRIVRWTYSPNFKIRGRVYYASPIVVWNVDEILKSTTVEGMVIRPYDIPPFSFSNKVVWKTEVETDRWINRRAKSISRPNPTVSSYRINLFDVEDKIPDKVQNKFDEMEDHLTGDNAVTPPCIREHYKSAKYKSGKGSPHWSRFIIGRWLQARGFSANQIANYFRFRINDPDDNSPQKRHTLLKWIPPMLGDPQNPHKVAGCGVMRDNPTSNFWVCDEKMQKECGRKKHPLERGYREVSSQPIGFAKRPVEVSGKNVKYFWKKITKLISEAFNKNKNLVLWKTTRAGVTTTIVSVAKELNKKVLVVVPTNRISETTFFDAVKIVKRETKQIINGAVLANNRTGCLILKFTEMELEDRKMREPDWGDRDIAWRKLSYHAKAECDKCHYKFNHITIPILNSKGEPEPLCHSAVTNFQQKLGFCAYTTFRENISDFDVVFVTYAKLRALMMNINQDNITLRDDLSNYFDIIVLDEVSTFANTSPLNIRLLKHSKPLSNMGETAIVDFFAVLRKEINDMYDFEGSRLTTFVEGIITRFITSFEYFKMIDWQKQENIMLVQDLPDGSGAHVIPHPLTYAEREELADKFQKIHNLLERYSKEENRALRSIEDVITLMSERSWIISSTPTEIYPVEVSMITTPKTGEVKDFIRGFSNPDEGKLVFATDACMPEVNISDFFQLDFDDFIIGDPRETNNTQTLIYDSRKVDSVTFSKGEQCIETECPYWDGQCNNEIIYTRNMPDPSGKREGKLKAFFNNKCYRKSIEFVREANKMADMYGEENLIVILPNMDIFRWFSNVRKLGAIPMRVSNTYYRSDKTVGVPCKRRVMLCMGLPYPPKGSHLWLAHFYHQDGLMRNYTLPQLAETLRQNSIRQAFWQTIGRAKSPTADEYSVVHLWGVNRNGLRQMYEFNNDIMINTLPGVGSVMGRFKASTRMIVGRFWRTFGKVPDPVMLKMSEMAHSEKWSGKWITHTEILQNVRGLNAKTLQNTIKTNNDKMFSYFGLEMMTKRYGGKTKIIIRGMSE